MNPSNLEEIKQKYRIGDKVRLVSMDDFQAPPEGTLGTVTHIDDMGQIHVNWENGSTLAVVLEAGDEVENLSELERAQEEITLE